MDKIQHGCAIGVLGFVGLSAVLILASCLGLNIPHVETVVFALGIAAFFLSLYFFAALLLEARQKRR